MLVEVVVHLPLQTARVLAGAFFGSAKGGSERGLLDLPTRQTIPWSSQQLNLNEAAMSFFSIITMNTNMFFSSLTWVRFHTTPALCRRCGHRCLPFSPHWNFAEGVANSTDTTRFCRRIGSPPMSVTGQIQWGRRLGLHFLVARNLHS